jgi:uncharacterized protein (DUF433 family)
MGLDATAPARWYDVRMRTVVAAHPFIELDERGVPWVRGTTAKVREVIMDGEQYRWDAHAMVPDFPSLTLVKILASFCYYFDNKDAMDLEIEEDFQEAERMRLESPPGPTRAELLERLKARESRTVPG